jgi:hypothetical protein
MRAAGRAVLDGLRREDGAALLTFSHRVRLPQALTRRHGLQRLGAAAPSKSRRRQVRLKGRRGAVTARAGYMAGT